MIRSSLLALLALAVPLQTQPGPDAVDRYVAEQMAARHIPGMQIAVVRDGNVVKTAGYGTASVELGVPVTDTTVFAIASTTKILSATAIMLLVQDGRLSLEAPVRTILPELPAAWSRITVEQLLSHTSGLPDVVDPTLPGAPAIAEKRADALAKIAGVPLRAAPGTAWEYNQTNYVLLGMIAERLTGKRWDELLRERVFRPAAMTRTTFGDGAEVVAGRGPLYTLLMSTDSGMAMGTTPRVKMQRFPEWLWMAGGINTTAADLARFDRLLRDDRFLRPELRRRMWTTVNRIDGTPLRLSGSPEGWGLGWWVRTTASGRRGVGMSGGGATAVQRYPDDGLTVIVLTNLQGAQPETLLDGIAALYPPGG